MRNFKLVIRAFVGAAAISTLVVGCEDAPAPKQAVTVAAPAPSTPEVRVTAPPPSPPVAETKAPEPAKTPATTTPELDDGSIAALLGQARDAMDKGDLSHALELARLATKKAPNRSAAFNTLGRVQLKRGERKDAIASFGKAVELNPSSSYAENNLGLALIYDGKYEDAVDALEEATQLLPVEPYMWNNLGMAYEHLDRLDDARDAYKQAVAAAADETGGAIAKANLGRLAGVKTIKPIKTAKIDSVKSGVVPVDEVNIGDGTTAANKPDGGVK